ncbi:signal peptidase, endoplasmic reticulum-type [Nocardioides sp. YR527]|uniref:signal peptidase I n=1 Tax=Nocardioides sp. YR527 TaxID=1881028 RepID=UPI000887A67B|nr:signal peptidase I [Nocardioides sp. YR527]SDJ76049.1 signal peptidase, endoplasmic reticulum-type [Nocardioides sp. YR527]
MTGAGTVSTRRPSSSGERRLPVPGPRALLGFVGQFVVWFVIIAAGAVIVLGVAAPRIVGGEAFTVLSGSMRPGMPPGSLVVVRPVDPATLRIGDVITFQLRSGEPAVATHRITGIGTDTTGERVFTTRGDANDADDVKPVRMVQVRGERWYWLPYVGHLNSLLTGEQRAITRLVGAGLLGGYALVMFGGSIRDRRRERAGEAAAKP